MFFQTSCFDNPAEKIAPKVKNVLEKLRKKIYVYKFWKTLFSPNCFAGIVEVLSATLENVLRKILREFARNSKKRKFMFFSEKTSKHSFGHVGINFSKTAIFVSPKVRKQCAIF